jgi:hypothetical protein
MRAASDARFAAAAAQGPVENLFTHIADPGHNTFFTN